MLRNVERRNCLKVAAGAIAGATTSLFAMPAVAKTASATAGIYDVAAFGAKGDGKTLDTPAINRAIEAAAAAGGGCVRFLAGTYLTYSVRLKSNVDLHLGPGVTILAAEPSVMEESRGYDPAEPNQWDKYQDFGHSHWHNSLFWGERIENVCITGAGLIWGKGLNRGTGNTTLAIGIGNKSISLKNCHNITLRDFSILHGGHFAVLATGVDNLTIDNLKIDTNRDGIDIDCCSNVRISNCSVNSPWDDGICLKSSYGLGSARFTQNVTVTNCYVTGGYEEGTLLDGTYKRWTADAAIPRLGRIKFGTESSGGFRNITIANCVIEDSHGLALETVDGAILEDVSITNITMRNIVDVPLFLRLGRRMRSPEGAQTGTLRRVNISNIMVSNCASRQASIITGIPGHYVEDVKLSNILVLHQGGGKEDDSMIHPPELETTYPDPETFGPMPVQGFFIRHVKNIEMRDVEIKCMIDDVRPAFLLEDVNGADFTHIKAGHVTGRSTFVLKNVKDFNSFQIGYTPDTHLATVEQYTF